MNSTDLYFSDAYLSHQIHILRLTAGEQKKVLKLLVKMQVELKSKLQNGLTDFGKRRITKLLKECETTISRYYKEMKGSLDIQALVAQEANFTVSAFAGISLDAALPTVAVMKSLTDDLILQGSPLSGWWAKQAQDTAFKFSNAVRQGSVQGETIPQIVRRVAGSKKLGIPGVMDISRRNASALVHSSIMQVANDSRMATFKANDDVVKGTRFLATFDSHTSQICMAHSGAEWDLEGNPTKGNLPFASPPLHFNCRSLLVPITLTFRELGIDAPEVKGTRASDLGQIKSDTTFDEFLKRHDAAYQDDLLGPGRAKLFRDGKLTMSDLMGQHDRPLSLDALKGK